MKPQIVTKGKYKLTHTKRRNDYGIMENWLEFSELRDDGITYCRFLMPEIRLSKYPNIDVFDTTNNYTKEQLEKILEEEINRK